MAVVEPVPFTEEHRTEASVILDRFQQIVDNEALVRGEYVTAVVAPERADAVCGGRNACAIGSLWLAAGIAPQRDRLPWGLSQWTLPGCSYGRAGFLDDKPALRLAYDVLNEAAGFYAEQADVTVFAMHTGELENLFEAGYRNWDAYNETGELIDPSELTQVVAIARDRLADLELAS